MVAPTLAVGNRRMVQTEPDFKVKRDVLTLRGWQKNNGEARATDSEVRTRRTIKLKGILPNTVSWVRILKDGRIEIEYYDRIAGVEDHSESDVAWMCRISSSEASRSCRLLEEHTTATITDDRAMLNAFAIPLRTLGLPAPGLAKRAFVAVSEATGA
jgi:hypothetical protein